MEEEIKDILANQKVAYLCTSDREGNPHITPVFFAYDFDRHEVYFVCRRSSKKMSNILKVRNIALTADIRDRENPFNNRGVLVNGEVFEITDLSAPMSKRSEKILGMLVQKYGKEIENFKEMLVTVLADRTTYWRGPSSKTMRFTEKNLSH